MAQGLRVGILNSEAADLGALRERLGGIECAPASFDAGSGSVQCPDGQPDAVLVYGTDDPDGAVELCRKVREATEGEEPPLLLAITAYQMFAAHELKKIPNSHYVLAPLEEEMVRERVDLLRRGQDW